jgi:hypothetical protein
MRRRGRRGQRRAAGKLAEVIASMLKRHNTMRNIGRDSWGSMIYL